MSKLLELADLYKSDKGKIVGSSTGFALIYEHLFGHLSNEKVKILEIGLNNGGPEHGSDKMNRVIQDCPSIKMWHEYFLNGDIWGWDINDIEVELLNSMDRFKFFKGDQGDFEAYKNFETLTENTYSGNNLFDFIIDDGSHAWYHQQMSFAHLSKLIKPGGYYIIEDLQWQPDEKQGGSKAGGTAPFDVRKLPHTVNTGKFFDALFPVSNSIPPNEDISDPSTGPATASQIEDSTHRGIHVELIKHINLLQERRPEYASVLLNEIKKYDRIDLDENVLSGAYSKNVHYGCILVLRKRK